MEQVTFGLLGAGRHALQSHLEPLLRLGQRVLVWDPDPRALAAALASGGAASADGAGAGQVVAAGSGDEVLAGCDGLLVCSPDRFHTPSLLAAARRELPVLVEKPVAVTPDDVVAAAGVLSGGFGPRVSTCHPRRTDPPFVALRGLLPELVAELGPVRRVVLDFDYPPPRAGQPVLHSSLLTDHVGHELDLVEFLLGVPALVDGADVLAAGLDPQVNYAVTGRRSDGVTFAFTGRRTDPARTGYDERLTLECATGSVTVSTRAGESFVQAPSGRRALPVGGTDYVERFRAVNANFVAMVTRGEHGYVTPAQILRNTAATVALHETGAFRLMT